MSVTYREKNEGLFYFGSDNNDVAEIDESVLSFLFLSSHLLDIKIALLIKLYKIYVDFS